MAFEDSATAGMTGNAQPTTTAPAPQPEQTTTVPASTELQAPAQPQAAAQRPAMQPVQTEENQTPGHFFKHLSHSFAGAILGSLAGSPSVDYSVDASGKTIATPRPDSTASRLRRIAESALIGLAAGSQVPSGPNRGAQWGKGIGMGAEAAMQRAQGQDLLKRQQAQQDFEEQQKTTLHKASLALTNAQTLNLWQKIADDENAKDAERTKNAGIVSDLQDYISQNPDSKLAVQMVTSEQARAILEADQKALVADPNHAHIAVSHLALPMGIEEAKDSEGNPIYESDGVTPKFVRKIAIISGAPDSKVAMPQNLIEAAQKYSKYDPRLRGAAQLSAGQEIPLSSFLSTYKFVTENTGKEADGWKKPEPVTVNGKLMERNTFTGETREPKGTPLTVEKELADIGEKKAGAFQKRAEGEKAQEETKQLKEWNQGGPDGKGRVDAFGNPVGAPGMDRKEYLKRVDAYTKDYSKDLNQLDAARSQLSDIIKNAEKTKKLPGADAVVGIFDAIGISSAPLKGRGFRINNSVVGEHVEGTRNAWQSMALKLSRLTPQGTGQIVSLQQLKDYERIMDVARHDAYVGAANDAVNRGIGIQIAPRGNGQPVDENTIDIFLTLSKGDPTLASALLKQFGWVAPGE